MGALTLVEEIRKRVEMAKSGRHIKLDEMKIMDDNFTGFQEEQKQNKRWPEARQHL